MDQPRRGRTVLVVDDEPTIAEVVARYLERAGYETATTGDGLEALRLAAERRPDLIVLDVIAALRLPAEAIEDDAGLGLAICRAIVETHGGRIWIGPSEQGTAVRFSLPNGAGHRPA